MQDKKNVFLRLIILRLVIATVILMPMAIVFGLRIPAVYWLIAVSYAVSILYLALLHGEKNRSGLIPYYVVAGLFIDTALVHVTGGIDSMLALLFPLTSISASLLISPRASVVFSLFSSAVYAGLVSLEVSGILPADSVSSPAMDPTYVFSVLYFRVTIFCIIGFLSSYIAEQIQRREADLVSLRERLRRDDRLTEIGKLAASTAHEIRNPLASISGCVETLKQGLVLDSKQEKLFLLILREISRLNTIINGMLEYSRTRPVRACRIDLREIVHSVVTLVQNNKDYNAEVQLLVENDTAARELWCDPEQMQQVLFNLVINAIDSVGAQGTVAIRLFSDEKRNTAGFEVRDSGAGMSPEQMQRLFEPFVSSKPHGAGLGLAIAAGIVNEHLGNIEVKSAPGKGALFRVSLPVTVDRQAAPAGVKR